jgi:anthranilate synthase component 1
MAERAHGFRRPSLSVSLGEQSGSAGADTPRPALSCSPTLAEFGRLAADHRIVPVWSEVVADTLTPVAAFLHVVGDGPGFLLESVEGGERWGRFSFVGRAPLATLVARGREVTASGPLDVATGDGGVLAALEALLDTYRSPALDGLPPLFAGVVGYLGYDVVREVEHLPDVPPDDQGFPDAGLVVIGQLCAFDHWRQRVVLVDNVAVEAAWGTDELEAAYRDAGRRLERLAEDCMRPTASHPIAPPDGEEPAADVTRTMTSRGYQDAVVAAKEYITAGDVFQVVISQRYDVGLGADPFDVYRCLRLLNPSPYLYFLRFDEVTVVGSSPEPMVRLRDGVVISRPIAGSRPRGRSESEDELAAAQLIEDPKELAEHVMLVDLARNDVGRVVHFGTEKVDEFMTVERYSHIMHLTSQVTGTLREDKGPIDVLRATLPAGTLSGAPKVRAMEIIDELEPTKRGIYGGVVGYLDFSGNLDTAIAIRTMVVAPDGRASVQAGAGIVADSDPETEDAECAHKAAALLAALAAARRVDRARPEPSDGRATT